MIFSIRKLTLLLIIFVFGSGANGQSENVTLLSHISLEDLGGGTSGSDLWGWQDSETGREYALVGRSNGMSFVDVTDGRNPVFLGELPTHTGDARWRDIKVYRDHAYVVADGNGPHGMQIFDLTQLRGVTTPQTWTSTAHYADNELRNAHNIAINEETGFAYLVGSLSLSAGGLHILDLSNPTAPVFAGEFTQDGFTHDVQVVIYDGPDLDYAGREICLLYTSPSPRDS